MKLFVVYSFDFFEQKGWIGEFYTEEKARECALRESRELFDSDEYAVVRALDNCRIAVYQSGYEQEKSSPNQI